MAEEREPEGGGPAPAFDTSAAALAVALGEARGRGRRRDAVDAFLEDQRALIADQRRHLHEQLKHLRLDHLSQRLTLTLQVATAAVGASILAGLGGMAWHAAHDRAVVVRAFTVPPAYAANGLTGDLLAERLIDDLLAIRARTAASSLGTTPELREAEEEVRIEIPETGVSVAEVQRLLTRWLGRQTAITGAATVETPGVLTLSAHTSGVGAVSVSGPADQLDTLMLQLAEKSFAIREPGQWSVYLRAVGRVDEAQAVARANALKGVATTPGVDYSLWANSEGDPARQVRLLHKALAINPQLMPGWRNLAYACRRLGDEQAALDASERVLALNDSDQRRVFSDRAVAQLRNNARGVIANLTGAYADPQSYRFAFDDQSAVLAHAHDGLAARRLAADDLDEERIGPEEAALTQVYAAEAAADWPAMAAAMAAYDRAQQAWFEAPAGPGLPPRAASPRMQAANAASRGRRDAPLRVRALALSGDIAGARAEAAALPLDCAACLRARAELATAARDWAAADAWYARAAAFAPGLPQAETLWGGSLLTRGDSAGAIARLKAAHAKGPRFADPLELWGEALMARGDLKGATARFREAARYAPRWGRLHLKWGEALRKLGATDDARAHFQAAAGLDLSARDRAELAAQHVQH